MKKIIDGVLYDTDAASSAIAIVHIDDYGREVYTTYQTSDGKYILHEEYYDEDGKLVREDLVDRTDVRKAGQELMDRFLG